MDLKNVETIFSIWVFWDVMLWQWVSGSIVIIPVKGNYGLIAPKDKSTTILQKVVNHPPTHQHSVTDQKTWILSITTVRNSDLTNDFHLLNLPNKFNSHQPTPYKVISGHAHTHHIREEICEVVLGKNLGVTRTVITPSDMWSSVPAVTSFNITFKQSAPSDIIESSIQTVSAPVTSLTSTFKQSVPQWHNWM